MVFIQETKKVCIKLIGDNMKYKSLEKLGFNKEKKNNRFMKFVNKTLTAIFLGLVLLIVMEYSPKFKNFMQNDVLNKNFSFGFIGKVYEKYFGGVLPQDNNNTIKVFNEKLTYKSKEKYKDGYKLIVDDNYLVPVIESGVVVFIGNKDDYGNVIIIEGEDNTTITYGNIKNTDIKLYDYVNKGKYLGEVSDNALYVLLLKGGKYLDIETYLS